jgi:hypothetical protein
LQTPPQTLLRRGLVLVVCTNTTALNLGGFVVAVYSRVKREGVKTIFRPPRDGILQLLRISKNEKHNLMYIRDNMATIYMGSGEFGSEKTLSPD